MSFHLPFICCQKPTFSKLPTSIANFEQSEIDHLFQLAFIQPRVHKYILSTHCVSVGYLLYQTVLKAQWPHPIQVSFFFNNVQHECPWWNCFSRQFSSKWQTQGPQILPSFRSSKFSPCRQKMRRQEQLCMGESSRPGLEVVTSLLTTSRWPELSHMTSPTCKGGWEM